MNIILDENAVLPKRSHEYDAGLDLFSKESKWIPAKGSAVFDTGIHIELQKGTTGIVKPRSGLNINHDLMCDGVIDYGYTGSIKVKLYNLGCTDYKVQKGDRIAQLLILAICIPQLNVVYKFEETERGNGGFGSTGR